MLKKIPHGIPCLIIILVIFGYMSSVMGLTNMLNTIMHTAHDLLLNTVFYIMGMCVITGALGKVFVEFGVVDLLQRMLRPVMRPVFNMPGVASLAAVLTFLSDNPAIIALSQDKGFARYFKKYQHVSLVNFGTAFGMGLLVIVFMVGQGYFLAPLRGPLRCPVRLRGGHAADAALHAEDVSPLPARGCHGGDPLQWWRGAARRELLAGGG